jgi:hypothetical protein
MSRLLSFIRLDLYTVKPYLTLKNLIIFALVALIMLVSNSSVDSNLGSSIGMLMAFAALYASYPFVVGEKSNIDILYTTLSIQRNTVVLGRYLFALGLDIVAGICAMAYSFVLLTILQRSFDPLGALPVMLVLFIAFSIVQAVQLPIYFKLGYAKAKFLAYLPFFALPLLVVAFSNFVRELLPDAFVSSLLTWLSSNAYLAAFVGVAIWFAILFLSYRLSLRFYKKRDF